MNKIRYLQKLIAFGLGCGLTCAIALAHAQARPPFPSPRHAPYPGGIAIVKLGEADSPVAEVLFNDKRVLTLRVADGFYAVVGIPLDAQPGMHNLQVRAANNGAQVNFTTAFEVKPKAYPTQHLQISPRFLQPSKADQERIAREVPIIIAAREHWSDAPPASFSLQQPSLGRLSSNFGLRRVLNGKDSAPHAGLDVAVPTGTPVRAAAAGRVVHTGDFFYAGKTVFLDHGQGFITVYLHLSRIDAKAGDGVEAGALLGAVGATGLVTGPHLHWGVLLNGTYVDPALFLSR